MKFREINKKYTELVNKYINEGYILNAGTMSGSQGEISKIDLIKGEELLRVWIDREYEWSEEKFHGHTVVLRVSRWTRQCLSRYRDDKVWMKDLNNLYEIKYYQLDEDWYLDSEEEASNRQKLHWQRIEAKYHDKQRRYLISDEAKEVAANYLKNNHGYRRITRQDIKIMIDTLKDGRSKYTIIYRERYYKVN